MAKDGFHMNSSKRQIRGIVRRTRGGMTGELLRAHVQLTINGAPVAWERCKDSADSADAMHDALFLLLYGDDFAIYRASDVVMNACTLMNEQGWPGAGFANVHGCCAVGVEEQCPETLRSAGVAAVAYGAAS